MIFGLILGVGWFAIYLAGHLAIIRYARDSSKARLSQRLLLVGLAGVIAGNVLGPCVVNSEPLLHGGWLLGSVWGTLTYMGLFCLYTPFYYVVTSSLSVHTMVIVWGNPENEHSLFALREVFASTQFVQQRLSTMLTNGFVSRRAPQDYALTSKGRGLARLFSWLKQFWKLGPGG